MLLRIHLNLGGLHKVGPRIIFTVGFANAVGAVKKQSSSKSK